MARGQSIRYATPIGLRKRAAEKKASGSKRVFTSDIKQEVRAHISDIVGNYLSTVPRILTLPDREGLCAIHFRAHLDGIEEIIGICDKERTVRENTLTESKGGKPVVDRYCKNSVANVVTMGMLDAGVSSRRVKPVAIEVQIVENISMHPTRICRPSPFRFGKFDFAFLDYCRQPSHAALVEVSSFIRYCTEKKWAVAVTFNLGGRDKTAYANIPAEQIVAPILEMTGARLICAEKYVNIQSAMMFAVFFDS